MGMAASQARYLALVARKSNCEYEGQQINQARLALSNQSANLFNQMLGLTVPTPPSTQDYTRTQYSFSDGNHSYVVDSWRQLPASETQYNYDVSVHYFTDVYTGAMKTMPDPQVQLSNPSGNISTLAQIEAMTAALRLAEDVMNTKYTFWQNTKSAQEALIAAYKDEASRGEIPYQYRCSIASVNPGGNILTDEDGNDYTISYDPQTGNIANTTGESILKELKNMLDIGAVSLSEIRTAMQTQYPECQIITDSSELDYTSGEQLTLLQQQVLQTYGLADSGANKFVVIKKDIEGIVNSLDDDPATPVQFFAYQYMGSGDFKTPEYYVGKISDCNAEIEIAKQAYEAAKDMYDQRLADYRSLCQPSYIGNSQLTYLDTLTESQEIELQQVVKDMIAQGIDTDILNCFDTYGNYLGGVYSFELYGVTYYTTYQNLLDAYASNTNSNNLIDDQYRMPYYNASYINTRIDQQGKALLETDGTGRFTTIRFENSSVSYSLNMETITDDEAYQDAMNQYYYENALYDKTVQDINAKTSIIQQEDSELELRLKQLDTEQNALKTEMDAVKKVIDDNIDNSFKTFGG